MLRFYETPAPLKAGRDLISERFTSLRRAKIPIPVKNSSHKILIIYEPKRSLYMKSAKSTTKKWCRRDNEQNYTLYDLYDIVGWDDMGMLGDLVEEFEEEAIKYLRIEKG